MDSRKPHYPVIIRKGVQHVLIGMKYVWWPFIDKAQDGPGPTAARNDIDEIYGWITRKNARLNKFKIVEVR